MTHTLEPKADSAISVPQWLAPDDTTAGAWQQPLEKLMSAPTGIGAAASRTPLESQLDEGKKERYRLYAYLVMRLVLENHNGNRFGLQGVYDDRAAETLPLLNPSQPNVYKPLDSYFGHNIACIAVDGAGHVIDFEFNHNEVFRSPIEHAEARLVRRIFGLNHLYDQHRLADPNNDDNYYKTLEQVTIVTSLESCAQCLGIMTLSAVKEVVYLQPDPGVSCLGNVLYNLSHDTNGKLLLGKTASPLPISGLDIDFPYFKTLMTEYQKFSKATGVFFSDPTKKQQPSFWKQPSIAAFLCTDTAKTIFQDASNKWDTARGQWESASEKAKQAIHQAFSGAVQSGSAATDTDATQVFDAACTDFGVAQLARLVYTPGQLDSSFQNDLVQLPSYPLQSMAANGVAAPAAIQPDQAAGELLLTNAGVFENTITFFDYVKARGFRATPHLD